MLRLQFIFLAFIITATCSNSSSRKDAGQPQLTAASLRADIREFLALLPHRRIGYIAAKHFILDAQFRQAFAYLRSQEFRTQWQRIRKTPEYRKIVGYIRTHGMVVGTAVSAADGSANDVSNAIDEIPNKLRSFKIPAKVPVSVMLEAERNLTTFLHEIVASLSREHIRAWFVRKVEEGGAFARFYKALRDEEFKKLLQTARHSSNWAAPIAELSGHHVDVDELISSGFEVLEWGP